MSSPPQLYLVIPVMPSARQLSVVILLMPSLPQLSLVIPVMPSARQLSVVILLMSSPSQLSLVLCCCCLPTPLTLASEGSPIFPLLVHQPVSPSIWPAVPSLRRDVSTNPVVTTWCVCECSWRPGVYVSVTYGA